MSKFECGLSADHERFFFFFYAVCSDICRLLFYSILHIG